MFADPWSNGKEKDPKREVSWKSLFKKNKYDFEAEKSETEIAVADSNGNDTRSYV
jgi:hypothetical protein